MSILLLETLHPDATALLEGWGTVVLAEGAGAVEAATAGGHVAAILTRGHGRVTRELLARCPELAVVARCGVGVDNIDVEAATARGIPVVFAPGSTTTAVAEHALMLMLAAARRLCTLNGAVHAGNWAIRNGWSSVELAGKTLGIVGLGDIGRRVAELADAFGMTIVYWSRSSRDDRYRYLPLDELLARSDVISLHVGLNDQTRHLFGAEELARMRPGAILINTARGGVVDQGAVAAALDAGPLGLFASDVLEGQPPPASDPLLGHQRVLLTPHVAALTDATYRHICVRSARNVLAILRGEPPEAEAIYNRERLESGEW